MWSQTKFRVSYAALFFSIIAHLLILIILLKSEVDNQKQLPPKIKVTLISSTALSALPSENKPSISPEAKIKAAPTQNNEVINPAGVSNDLSMPTLPAALSSTQDTEKSNPETFNTENVYDPLLDAQNRAKKAVKQAKKVSREYQANIKPLDTHFLDTHAIETMPSFDTQSLENQHAIFEPTKEALNLYQVEVINDSKDRQLLLNILPSKAEDQDKIDLLKQELKLLFENDIFSKKVNSDTSIIFTVDPQNLMVFIEVVPASIEFEQKLAPLIRQLNFDLILINAHLNDSPYSFSIEFEHE